MKITKKNQTFNLIKKFQQGDKDTFDKLNIYYRPYVYRVALKFLRSRDDAEDLTQEVFIKLYENLKDFKFKSNLKTYLYRITINSACNYYNKKKKYQDRINYLTEEVISDNNTTDEKIIEKETLSNLEKALSNLQENHKEVIILKDFQNLNHKKIAKQLNITENAAKIRHHYALKKLRNSFFSIA